MLLAVSVFVVLLWLPAPEGFAPAAWRVAAIAALMAILWLSEAVPLAATALLPLVLFPLLGVTPIEQTAAPYANPIVFLLLGGFILGRAIEHWDLHRRIALTVVLHTGSREDMQIAGFMVATAALSMWISNTATTIMMLPVALSIIPRGAGGELDAARRGFATALLLSVAYAANIGGVGTLIGTPPNAMLAGFMLENFAVEIGFAQWMLIGMPVVASMLILCWLLLTRVLYKIGRNEAGDTEAAVREALRRLGPASPAEKRVAAVCLLTAALWVLRPLLQRAFPELMLSDAGIAMLGALALFVVPSGGRKGEFLLTWRTAERLPWGVLLLVGGGLSLASGVSESGLAAGIGASLSSLGMWSPLLIVVVVAGLMVFLTELTSNAGTTATFLPVVAALALSAGQDPLLFAVPAVIAASFAFMMPVATPPNAIVFASGHVTIAQMVRAGFWLNLIGVAVIVVIVYTLTNVVLA